MPFLKPEQLLTSSTRTDLEAKHRRIVVMQIPAYLTEAESADPSTPPAAVGAEVVFRAATQPEYAMFKAQATSDDAQKYAAQTTLALCTVVHVTGANAGEDARAAFGRVLADWPGIADACAGEIGKLVGIGAATRAKK